MRLCPQCQSSCDDAHKFCPTCGFPVGKVAENPDDPMIGRTLPGGYIILDLVGVGGMGRVYRAEQTNLSRTVAVKIIHPHLIGEENAAARFITEARAASRLNHPNSVGVIDFGKTEDGQLYLVMEFLRGKDLARVVYEAGELPFSRVVQILRQVLAALAEAHHLEIIHRDLKPENIILEPVRSGGDFVKVVDFGLAKMREASGPGITSPGIVCGTPEYMSPEQGRGDALDPRSDIYAVGVIMFQLLTGRLPFEADSPTQVVLMHIGDPPPDPNVVAPSRNIPPQLVEVCLMALAKEPHHRFANADEFSGALEDALAQSEAAKKPVTRDSGAGIKCGQCGAANGMAQKFCGECGAPLAATVRSSPSRQSQVDPAELVPPSGISPPAVARAVVVDMDRVGFPLPLVGRSDDLGWLADRLSDAKERLAGARLVGDHGMGKTRLLGEFLTMCRENGSIVASTAPDPYWAEVGFYAVGRAVRELLGLTGTVLASDLEGLPTNVRRGLSLVLDVSLMPATNGTPPPPSATTSEELRSFVADGLRYAIVEAHQRSGKPIVLAVDDLHQIDGGSRAAFSDVVGDPPEVPALLVGTYPPGADPGWSANTSAARVLTGIAPNVAAKLISGASSSSSPSIGPSARGIAPLYLEQLLRFTREGGGAPPPRLADLIALRVERLPPDSRRVLQAIAVYGDDVTEDTVLRMVRGHTNVEGAVGALVAAGIVERSKQARRVAHPLIREVVLATIPAAVRRELHVIAGEVGEEIGVPLEARAAHEFHGQNTFQALILLEQVSARCAARGDLLGSITALRRCLELARREVFRGELDDPLRAVLIFSRKLGEALNNAGQFTDAEGVLREAIDMAGPSGEERARLLGVLAQVSRGRDRKREAKMYLREAMELAFESGARDLLLSLEDLQRAMTI